MNPTSRRQAPTGTAALTERQAEVLEFIGDAIRTNGMAPTVKEICTHFGFASPKAAQDHVSALVKKGALEKLGNKARALRPVFGGARGIAILGDMAAGTPIAALENLRGTLELDSLFGTGRLFAVQVKGDSMRDGGILDGDFVIVRIQPTVENGAIVVAYIAGEATVKRVVKTRRGYRLQPENAAHRPIDIDASTDDFRLAGPVVGVIRSTPGGIA
jgi:repressor LexA